MSPADRIASVCCARTVCATRPREGSGGDARRQNGFTLIELMLVVVVIGILASIAMPALIRARSSAMEVSTIGTLRALNTAQASFAATCGAGLFAPSMIWLSKAPPGRPDAFIGSGFNATTVDKAGYRFRLTAGTTMPKSPQTCNGLAAGSSVNGYFIGADPLLVGTAGFPSRYFGTSSGGTIYQSTIRVPNFFTGSPVAPAKPIQ